MFRNKDTHNETFPLEKHRSETKKYVAEHLKKLEAHPQMQKPQRESVQYSIACVRCHHRTDGET